MTLVRSSHGGFLRSVGPAIIVGSVVLGPGTILAATKTGCAFGYDLVWLVGGVGLLMFGMTALSARLGVTCEGTPCDELARHAGRPVAALVGVVLFLVVACFQFSNNIGVLAAITPFVDGTGSWPIAVLVGLNVAVILALFRFRRLYRPVEVLMKALVLLMVVGFAGNMIIVRPSLSATAGGLVPRLPETTGAGFVPVIGLVATTFSVAGAFFQAYLVRKRGWTAANLRQGLVDSAVGIGVLAAVTAMIMITSAAVLHGSVAPGDLKGADHVAHVLEPLLGGGAKALFCVGLMAGALSSFLVNAMIGGTVLSDGLGLGSDVDGRWPRLFTVAALLVGMGVAIPVHQSGQKPVDLIVFAQALTVLGNPLLAGTLLWLAFRRPSPTWLRALVTAGVVVTVVLAWRKGVGLWG
ncbi:MAG: manganese transporter [Planctomycetes bacterium]|nr:manganese transporter [Planctomycetota bacterium]